MKNQRLILVIIVFAQFCCTSLWFAGNSVINDLILTFDLKANALSHLTSAVQFGFITGTLIFALFTVSDRFPPSRVFFICALLGALFNLGILLPYNNLFSLVFFRFLTGIFLAGIYPVGMKIAADYFEKGLGKSLGFLVGALVLGTAFPHFLKGFNLGLNWQLIAVFTSSIAVLGGLAMLLLVPNGPFRKIGQKPDITAWLKSFKNPYFRSAAFGYFGHMWELYAFWAFVPVMLNTYALFHSQANWNISILSFVVIGLGSLSCVFGGYLAQYFGAKKVAFTALLLSCVCCLISPLVFSFGSANLFIGFLIIWGLAVIADSPLFSSLVAQNAIPETKGTALTIVNCIGFSITIISIQLINLMMKSLNPNYVYIILALGPILGLVALLPQKKTATQ